MTKIDGWLVLALLSGFTVTSCSSSSSSDEDDAGADGDTDTDTDGDSDGDSDGDADCGWEVVVEEYELGIGVFEDVWSSGPDDVFAVGSVGIIHFDGVEWVLQMEPGNNLEGVWGTAPDNVYAVGGDGVFHFNGESWSQEDLPDQYGGVAVWGSSSEDVFVVGYGDRILHFNGSDWEFMELPVGDDLVWEDVWGASSSDVFVVGYEYAGSYPARAAHYDGNEWSMMLVDDEWDRLFGVWGTAPDDVYAVGQYPCVFHYEDALWEVFFDCVDGIDEEPYMSALNAVWGTSPDNIYVGDSENVWRYDGEGWRADYTHPQLDANSIWGTGENDIYVAGDIIVHYGCEQE